jgi:multicomponent Na+:H+ antiporter subunit E
MIIITLAILALYLALTANFALNNIITGLVLAALIAWLIRPTHKTFSLSQLPRAFVASVRYLVGLLWDLIKSGIQVTLLVLQKEPLTKTGIIAIPSGSESEMGTALSAHAITLTPGEMVVEIEGDIMYTHCLDVTHAEEMVQHAQAYRRNLLSQIIP